MRKLHSAVILGGGLILAMTAWLGWSLLFSETAHAQTAYNCRNVTTIPLEQCQGLKALYNNVGGTEWFFQDNWLKTSDPCEWAGVACRDGQVVALDLEDNNLAGQLTPAVRRLTTLEHLDLSQNRLSGPLPGTALGDLKSLQFLNLLDNEFSGGIPPQLRLMTALQVLDLGDNQLSGPIPPQLGQLSNLQQLFLNNNPNLTGPLPNALRNAPLTVFWYQNTQLCTPTTAGFVNWLDDMSIVWHAGITCDSTEPTPTAIPPTAIPPTAIPPTNTPEPTVTPIAPECPANSVEAEAGVLSGGFTVQTDSRAGGGAYVVLPNGRKSSNALDPSIAARYCISVSSAGVYRIQGRVRAPTYGDDSFYVTVDGGAIWVWDTDHNGSGFIDDFVNDRNKADPVEIYLTAGDHEITLYAREDGSGLDTLTLIPTGR